MPIKYAHSHNQVKSILTMAIGTATPINEGNVRSVLGPNSLYVWVFFHKFKIMHI